MRLQSTYTHKNTELQIVVNYEPKENIVDEVIGVYAVDIKKAQWVDITEIATEYLAIDDIIDKTNWRMLYAEQRPDSINSFI